jgi:hypothetical protein
LRPDLQSGLSEENEHSYSLSKKSSAESYVS